MHISTIRNIGQIFQVLRKLLFVKIWAWIRLEYKNWDWCWILMDRKWKVIFWGKMSLQPLTFIVNTSLRHPIWETMNAKPGQWQEMRFSQVNIGIDRQWNYKEKWQLITKNQIEALVVQKNTKSDFGYNDWVRRFVFFLLKH